MPRESEANPSRSLNKLIKTLAGWGRHPVRLHWHVVLLVFAVAVPLLLFSTILIRQEIRNKHDALERGLRDTVRALSSASDREVATARLLLEVLGKSQYLDGADFRAFHQLS